MVFNSDNEKLKQLADEVLTFIEQREAEQIAYGIYDVTMTVADVIDEFEPSEDIRLSVEQRTEALNQALNKLAEDLDIIRFDSPESPRNWVFRSRIAEIVRLLSKLRQRIVKEDKYKDQHRISNSKQLVADVKFSVASRRVPRRDIPVEDCIKSLSNGNSEHRQVSKILLEVINTALPKLRNMSGFQHRTLENILKAIELDRQQGTERGVVVTANTGAGKTYAFFLPILAKIILERCLRGRKGVKAICIYPRVALSENQFSDFIEVLFYLNQVLEGENLPAVTIGIETGAAVYTLNELNITQKQQESLAKRGWKFSDTWQGYLSPFAYCVGTDEKSCKDTRQPLLVQPTYPQTLVCPVCSKQYPFIKFSRDVMAEHPPDLLIATTESLHKRLISSKYQYLFGTTRFGTTPFCAPSVVMLDEIHLQTSTAGTQVALLLRRLLARIRLGKQNRNESDNLAFVGLSATIAEPIQFLSELSGIPVTRITQVKPNDDEMQTLGAERFIFIRAEENEDTAVISTLIQTAMCVLHTMPQPESNSKLQRYRTFGFVQSLDIVGRWLYQMEDAEKVRPEQKHRREGYKTEKKSLENRPIYDIPLYAYRFPPYNRQLFPNFFGKSTNSDCDCHKNNHPNLDCRFFQAGECWWVLSQKDKARRESLNIKRKSGSDRSIPIDSEDDLVITTSALEVGYDDEALMCVLQYMAPANVASFVQRKGRGGRKVGTRPIVVTVLSPYKTTDIFLFRNEHILTDPTFNKLPLNAQNRYLQRIHGFYALWDWLAYRAHLAGVNLDLDRLEREGYNYLMQETGELAVLVEFKNYLQNTFEIPDHALIEVLTSNTEGLLKQTFYQGLMTTISPVFEQKQQQFVEPRQELKKYLPDNLFSDINLPEVQVDYRPEYRGTNKHIPSESISLAITETIPGNVTFRGGQGSIWIAPEVSDGEAPLIPIDRYYKFTPIEDRPNTPNLPMRALKMVGIQPSSMNRLDLYRPEAINPTRFSKDHNSSFWYCNPKTGELQQHTNINAPQNMQQLAHGSNAYPIVAVDINPIRGTLPPPEEYIFKPDSPLIACDSLGKTLTESIILYSDEPNNLNLLDVRRIILGSQYTIKFHNSTVDEIRGIIGFKKTDDSIKNCALGYQLITEGISLDINLKILHNLTLSSSTESLLCLNAIRHAFVTDLTVEHQENYFAAENLADVLLTLTDKWCNEESNSLDTVRSLFSRSNKEFERKLSESINQIHKLSNKNRKALLKLTDNPNYLERFLDLYEDVHGRGQVYQQYLRDTFQYSLTEALKQLAQEVAGVEALNYVAAWTYLEADFEKRPANRIWLYEIGMGGIGVMRGTHDLLRNYPDQFWSKLAQKMTYCPTSQEEAFLRYLLAQPESWLCQCEKLVTNITNPGSSVNRQTAIETLLAEVRRQLGVIVRQEQLKTLLRVFIADYTQEIDGQPITNWRLFREINHEFLPCCVQKLGRDPSFTEARSLLYQEINQAIQGEQNSCYPELKRLFKLYQQNYSQDTQKAFEAAVERRMLLNCRCNCPSCLNDRSGDIEPPRMSRNLLNRPLLTEWVMQTRQNHTLEIDKVGNPADLCEQIRQLLENGYQAIYLRVPSDKLTNLCATLSYLTDAGIDTDFGMVYPMITDIKTIYCNSLMSTERPRIEVTIRPIE